MSRRCLAIAALALAATLSPAHAESETFTARTSAYCESGTTRSGVYTHPGTIAVDPRWIPLGSTVAIEGLPGLYTAEDTGSAVVGPLIDIYMADCGAAINWGVRYLTVEVLP